MADFTDTNLVNPWGIAFSATSPFWIKAGQRHRPVRALQQHRRCHPVARRHHPAARRLLRTARRLLYRHHRQFRGRFLRDRHRHGAFFILNGRAGTIAAWSSGSNAVLKVDYSSSNAIFKGLASGSVGASNYIYATDFHNGQVDVFDTNYAQVTLAGNFMDGSLPAGYAPFGIQNINGKLFVTYALQDADKEDDVGGLGNGYVDIFDTSGNLVQRLIAQSVLNSPWGLALAPVGFGAFGGDLLVGNFGDGRINVFNPADGTWLGELMSSTNGTPIEVRGLWAIAFGNGHSGGDAYTLYFTAGINGESDGLFGSIAAITPTFIGITNNGPGITMNWAGGGAGPFLLQQNTNLSGTNWVTIGTSSSSSVTVANTNTAAFFRLQVQ